MHRAHSEDEGETWTPMVSNGLECVMRFCSIQPIDGGARLLGITNIGRDEDPNNRKPMTRAKAGRSRGAAFLVSSRRT